MRVLVAGASRGVGLLACQRLVDLGHGVRGLSRSAGPGIQGVEWQAGDLLDPATCASAVMGCEAVVCAAGERRVPEGREIVDGPGIVQLIDAARDAGVRRFVLVSSLGVGGSWHSVPFPVRWFFKASGSLPILEAKAVSEERLRESGISWTILHPGFLTNHRMRAEPFCREGIVPGLTTRQAVADVAVRSLQSRTAEERCLAVCNRWLGWMAGPECSLEVDWAGW